jgi:TonB family protein
VRGTVPDRDAVTLKTKDSPELNSPGKPGAASQNSENKAGQSPRSNPVCLEVGVTIRSLPNEANGQTQPIREDGRTVIVFDNGAVLRSANQMPIGQTVILSNPNGRDVVCRVVGGRNLPSVKGYVEVEFLEPVNDFWGIHREGNPATVAAPSAASPALREVPAPRPPAPLRATSSVEAPAKPASVSLGRGPTFEDVPEIASMSSSSATRESKTEPARPAPEKISKDASEYNRSENASPTSLANWNSTPAELPVEKHAIAAMRDALSTTSPAPTRDFLSKGLMAYEQPRSSSSGSNGRTPLIVGVAALVLAGVGAAVYVMHGKSTPVPVAKTAVVSQPSAPVPPAASIASEPVKAPLDAAAQAATQAQTPAEPVAVEQAQPVAAAPVPAVVKSPATADSRPESRPEPRNVRREEKNTVVTKQPDLPSSRRPVIPNLKMGSPSAPDKNLSNPGEGATPMTDIASTETVGGVPATGLLTSAGRTSNPPAPPPSVLPPLVPAPPAPAPVAAPKTASSPKMISSTRPVYPATARQSKIQGIVTVFANIDANGKVVNARALNGPLLLQQAAVDSVKQWKYSPGMIDGKPAPSQVTVGVEFRMN